MKNNIQPDYENIRKVFLRVVRSYPKDEPLATIFSEVMKETGCNVMQLRMALDRWKAVSVAPKD